MGLLFGMTSLASSTRFHQLWRSFENDDYVLPHLASFLIKFIQPTPSYLLTLFNNNSSVI